MGKDNGKRNGKPISKTNKSSKGESTGTGLKSFSDVLAHKKNYKPDSTGGGKKANKSYQKSWGKSADKYNTDKANNNSDANFKKSGGKKEAPRTEKEIKMDRKKSKPNFELVESMKTSWNKVRTKSTSDDEKQLLLTKMSKQMEGHVLQVTLRHDASRMTQCLLQFGNDDQKQKVLNELLDKTVEISRTPYGHFAILKAISYCTSINDQRRIINSMSGNFVTLGTNVIGARTVESICTLLNYKLWKNLKAEFYGKQFNLLLDSSPSSLKDLINRSNNSKKDAILDHFRDLIQKFIDKGLLEFRYVHDLIWEYTQIISGVNLSNANANASSSDGEENVYDSKRMDDLAQQLSDSTPKLISSKPGSRTICQIITYSGAKERKRIIKSLKGKVVESLLNDSAHLAIMRLIDVTDDTVTIQKTLLEELKTTNAVEKYTASGELKDVPLPPLITIATNAVGKKFLLRLLSPNIRHIEPDEDYIFEINSPYSKKDNNIRRKEHLKFLQDTVIKLFTNTFYADIVVRNIHGNKIMENVIKVFYDHNILNSLVNVYAGEITDTTDSSNTNLLNSQKKKISVEESDSESGSGSDSDSNSDSDEDEDEDEDEDAKELKKADLENQDSDEEQDEPVTDTATSKSKKVKSTTYVAKIEPEVAISIEEDKIAHTFIKRLFLFENNAYDATATAIETDLWTGAITETRVFTNNLYNKLTTNDNSLILKWILCNRGCYTLLSMLNANSDTSTSTSISDKLRVLLKKLVTSKDLNGSSNGGAKALVDAVAVPSDSKGKVEAKAKTPAKSAASASAPATGKKSKAATPKKEEDTPAKRTRRK